MPDPILTQATSLLSTNRGLAIGEVHGDLSNPEWVNANLPAFKATGVNTLFMEMFQKSDQPLIDAYYRGDEQAGIQLRALLRPRWEGRMHVSGTDEAYFSMLKAARDAGIKVVGIDIPTPPGEERLAYANPRWADTIEAYLREHPDAGKFLVYAGSNHTARVAYTENTTVLKDGESTTVSTPIALGIDARLNIPSIDFNVYRVAQTRGQAVVTPTTLSIAPGDGQDSSLSAVLPPSINERLNPQTPAAPYKLPPEVEAQVAAISGIQMQYTLTDALRAHGSSPNIGPQGGSPSVGPAVPPR